MAFGRRPWDDLGNERGFQAFKSPSRGFPLTEVLSGLIRWVVVAFEGGCNLQIVKSLCKTYGLEGVRDF